MNFEVSDLSTTHSARLGVRSIPAMEVKPLFPATPGRIAIPFKRTIVRVDVVTWKDAGLVTFFKLFLLLRAAQQSSSEATLSRQVKRTARI